MDSLVGFHLLSDQATNTGQLEHMAIDIKELIHRDWQVKLMHIRRGANQVAESLAKGQFGRGPGMVWFEEPPNFLAPILAEDNRNIFISSPSIRPF